MKAILAEKLLSKEEFEGAMSYLTLRGDSSRSRALIHGFHVLGLPLSTIAAQNDCTRQNVVRALERFAVAYERYVEVQSHILEKAPANAAPAGKKKATPGKGSSPGRPAAKKPVAAVRKSTPKLASKPASKKAAAPVAKKVAAKKAPPRSGAGSR